MCGILEMFEERVAKQPHIEFFLKELFDAIDRPLVPHAGTEEGFFEHQEDALEDEDLGA